jgi:hypothetical protein
MRFSSAFTLPLPLVRTAQPGERVRAAEDAPSQRGAPVVAEATRRGLQDLPDELDARVRLVGEWQLGEG